MDVKQQGMNQTMNQAIDAMLIRAKAKPQTPKGRQAQDKGDGNSKFGSMVRQKQAGRSEKETGGAEAVQEPQDVAPAQETQPGDEQYAVAAAMMMAVPILPEVQMATEEQIQPRIEMAAEAEGPMEVLEALPELAVKPDLPETAEAAPEIAQALAEAVERPREEAAPEELMTAAGDVAEVRQAPEETVLQAAPEEEAMPVQGQGNAAQETAPAQVQESQADKPLEAPSVRVQEGQEQESGAPDGQQAQAGVPVFRQTEAAPVKVAEPEQPLALEEPQAMEKLSARIEELVTDPTGQRLELTLTPPNLGRISVQLSHDNSGNLHVVLTATTARAAAVLERGTGSLQNLLSANTRSEVNIEVRGNEESQRQFLNPDGESDQQRRQQQQQQQRRSGHEGQRGEDFIQQLRLGLVGLDGE